MIKGEKVRFDIHKILYSIYKFNKTLNSLDIKEIISSHNTNDISFLNNVALSSMRYYLHSSKIMKKYINKKIKDKEKILLISAITQIVFLDFKDYAVINCSVEIAKKLNIYHGFINACLKNISKEKNQLKNIKIDFNDLPLWFKNQSTSLTNNEKDIFLNNFTKKPSLHIVFKNEIKLHKFENDLIKTSEVSGFFINKKNLNDIESFIRGDWWVQDFSSFFPLYNLKIKNSARVLDTCAAPGGKSFQILSRNGNLTLNDKSLSRIQILKSNLNRLNYKTKILNYDFTKFNEEEKYDLIIIDAPCSAVGTIRKNPEIFFKAKAPNFKDLILIQKNMLKKASKLININGLILYMVCSFLKNETTEQIENFLSTQTNFELYNFNLIDNRKEYLKLFHNNIMITLPETILNYNIDGYFAACLKRIK
tara:strand:- start:568 stop:1833 length:1266 start_codon:yes stop_codon:yes gene_type:complete